MSACLSVSVSMHVCLPVSVHVCVCMPAGVKCGGHASGDAVYMLVSQVVVSIAQPALPAASSIASQNMSARWHTISH